MVTVVGSRGVRSTSPILRTLLAGFIVACVGAVMLAAVDVVAAPGALAGPVVYGVGASLLLTHWGDGARFGAANTVTLTRLIGTSWLVVLGVGAATVGTGRPARIALVVVGASCLLLDHVDGRLARSRAEASAFGARFDMETDAAMLLVLSVAVPVLGIAGWWVVAIGAMRYASAVASWLVPILRTSVFYSYARKAVAGVQGVALLFALLASVVTVIPAWVSTAVLATALGLLCWSFGRDIRWQITRNRRGDTTPYRPSM